MLTQRHYTILIVDDLQDNQEMYRCYLTTDSDIAYTILEAKSAKDTLTLCRTLATGSDRSTLDAILLKCNLSDGDGLDILTTLKAQLGENCPPVIIIDDDNIALAVRAIKEGAEDYLVHAQITPEQLRFTIKSAIESGKRRRIVHNSKRAAELEATLQSYYDNAPMMMGVVELTDNDIIHIYDNGATCDFFGTAPNSTIGKLASELGVAPDVIQKWLGYYRESQERREPVQFEYVNYDGSKNLRFLWVTVFPIKPALFASPRFCYVAEDITERKRPQGGQVELRLSPVNSYAQISVSDTGKGINPTFLPHIFEHFRQEDTSITREFGGLGLGLAIVSKLVELHGGTIEANSPGLGQGATFIVKLPLITSNLE